MGRFWNADTLAGSAENPGSLNRYAFVQGDPVNYGDPNGNNLVSAGGGLVFDCGDDADSIYDGSCTIVAAGGGGGLPCGFAYGTVCGFAPILPIICAGGNNLLGGGGSGCGGGGGGPAPELAPTITLRQIDDCIQPHGTGINPGVWTLFVEYQVLVNGAPVYGNSALNALGIVITESVTKTSGNIDITGGPGWCPVGGSCGANAGTMNSSGDFWDMLAGQGAASQSFLFNGQPIAVSFAGVSGSQTVLKNTYDSRGHKISVGGGALAGTNATRECGKNGDPGR